MFIYGGYAGVRDMMTPDCCLHRAEITAKITSSSGSGGSLFRKRETVVGGIYEKIEIRI